jgi:NSS family neurotransmitter:Na+ symporter
MEAIFMDGNKAARGNNILADEIRDLFSSRWGFIVACIGSAVGMGNIWMFPYRVGAFGGAAFLVAYILIVVAIGFIGVAGEMTLGRGTGEGPLGAFRKAMEARGNPKLGEFIGLVPVIGQLGTAIGYSVVMAWVIRFLAGAVTGGAYRAEDIGAYFGALASGFGCVPWHSLTLAIAFYIMLAGISKGIERINRFMMPAFFVLFMVLAVRALTLPGAEDGLRYLFNPKWESLLEPRTWVFALGQAFFSLSIAGGGTVVYGSYLAKGENIVKSAALVAVFDTLAAFLAALVIIPSVFAFGMDPAAGPSLMFITMPAVFRQMPMGQIFMVIFFVAVLFAGMTSLVNLFESPIEALQGKFNFSRAKAVGFVALVSVAVGLFIEGIVGEWMDIVTIYIVPLGAVLAAILLWWALGTKWARTEAETGMDKPLGSWFEPMGKYVFCGITIVVYILGVFYGGIG